MWQLERGCFFKDQIGASAYRNETPWAPIETGQLQNETQKDRGVDDLSQPVQAKKLRIWPGVRNLRGISKARGEKAKANTSSEPEVQEMEM